MQKLPRVPETLSGEILFRPTEEARKHARSSRDLPKLLKEVHDQALAELHKEGIKDPDLFDIRGRYRIQLGKYQGQTLHWLCENDIGYTTYLVISAQTEGGFADNPYGDSKKQLKIYLESFPAGRRALAQKRQHTEESKGLMKKAEAKKSPAKTPEGSDLPDDVLVKLVEQHERESSQPTFPESTSQRDVPTAAISVSLTSTTEPVPGTSATPCKKSRLSELRGVPQLSGTQKLDKYPLPEGWKTGLDEADHQWVSSAMFKKGPTGNLVLKTELLRLWMEPPQPSLTVNQIPRVHSYFTHRLCVWMPKRLWKVRLVCLDVDCKRRELTHSGVYGIVRRVLDVASYYNIVTERLECGTCEKRYIAWSLAILDQLDIGHRNLFPAILTYRRACDNKVISMLRMRGLGNSAMQEQRKLAESHSEAWMRQCLHYLSACQVYIQAGKSGLIDRPSFHEPPPSREVPSANWLRLVYSHDVMSRITELKAAITSTFGQVLKVDSTKKVAKKLAGYSAGTAAWVTNIGNENGEILMSVLTSAEGHGLDLMFTGLVDRYINADVAPPSVIYVDRDCCDRKLRRQFAAWSEVSIRLDIWHFMRRFGRCCTTDAHQLYPVFMSCLSKCIFAWSNEDVGLLREAKRAELIQQGLIDPSSSDILRYISKRELALHCRRQTRGVEETTRLIQALLEAFTGDQGLDALGVPLLHNEKTWILWESQKKHVACIQDPPHFPLYTKTGTVKKGGIELPVFRCARGSTSLESFHLHLARFIPGTTASDVHFQAYFLDGIKRWNEDRFKSSVIHQTPTASSYTGILRHGLNELSEDILGKKLVPEYRQPRKYTGELIGVDYLYRQNNQPLQEINLDPESEQAARFDPEIDEEDDVVDEGFQEEVEDATVAVPDDVSLQPSPTKAPSRPRVPSKRSIQAVSPDDIAEPTQPHEEMDTSETVGPDNVPGYAEVDALAEYLSQLRNQRAPLSNAQADHIYDLWSDLSEFDKRGSKIQPRYKTRVDVGTFKSSPRTRSEFTPGVDSVKRCLIGTGGPANYPDANRVMECVIIKLCSRYPSPVKQDSKMIQRWSLVVGAYKNIRDKVVSNQKLMSLTNLMLLNINQKTLAAWDNKRTTLQDRLVLEQGIRLPLPAMTATSKLPPARELPVATKLSPISPEHQHEYRLPPITAGQGGVRRRVLVSESPANPSSSPRPILPAAVISPSSALPQLHGDLPKSTLWYKKKQINKYNAGEYVKTYQKRRQSHMYTCGKCGNLRTPDTHKHFMGSWWCSIASQQTEQVWRTEQEKRLIEKKRMKEQQRQQQLHADTDDDNDNK